MTTLQDDMTDVHPGRAKIEISLALALTVPGFVVRFTHPDISHPLEAFLFGLAIVGAAFMLSWAAEAAQLDISAGLAIAILALIAARRLMKSGRAASPARSEAASGLSQRYRLRSALARSGRPCSSRSTMAKARS